MNQVPYTNQNGKTVMGDKPKALSEWKTIDDGSGKIVVDKSKIVCYAYLNKKGKQKDKVRPCTRCLLCLTPFLIDSLH